MYQSLALIVFRMFFLWFAKGFLRHVLFCTHLNQKQFSYERLGLLLDFFMRNRKITMFDKRSSLLMSQLTSTCSKNEVNDAVLMFLLLTLEIFYTFF